MSESNMENYSQFIDKLKIELQSFISTPKEIWDKNAIKYVDGLAAAELRRLINIETRRKYGAFFTDSVLAKKVLTLLKPSFTKDSYIYDPACGGGNLLIAVADYLKDLNIDSNLESHLLGTDIHQEFVDASKLRLITNTLLKQPINTKSAFNSQKAKKYSVIKGNGLEKNRFYEKATHIIVNPPFNMTSTEEKLNWSKGQVSSAALFIDKIIQYSNPGTSIIAILPDVLRSGSRYEKWRTMVEEKCSIEKIKLLGQFDKYADVDVYAISLTKLGKIGITNKRKTHKNIIKQKGIQMIKELFDVCVGPVVDNRDPNKGPLRPYIISKGLEGWSIETSASLNRRHSGKSFDSPFVVIKRTSRLSDSQRAIATIINIPEPVYIDNHLIVLKPKSGKLTDCYKIQEVLKDIRTNTWVNKEIRCRHLTVKIVSDLPVWE
jgi:hypothetical protein